MSDIPSGFDREPPKNGEREADAQAFEVIKVLRENAFSLEENEQYFRDYLQMVSSRMDVFRFKRKIHNVDSLTDVEEYRFTPRNENVMERISFERNNIVDSLSARLDIMIDVPDESIGVQTLLLHFDKKEKGSIQLMSQVFGHSQDIANHIDDFMSGDADRIRMFTPHQQEAVIRSGKTAVLRRGAPMDLPLENRELEVDEIVTNPDFINPSESTA